MVGCSAKCLCLFPGCSCVYCTVLCTISIVYCVVIVVSCVICGAIYCSFVKVYYMEVEVADSASVLVIVKCVELSIGGSKNLCYPDTISSRRQTYSVIYCLLVMFVKDLGMVYVLVLPSVWLYCHWV